MNNTYLPYTRTNKKLNKAIGKAMKYYEKFLRKTKKLGFDVRFSPDDKLPLALYFHDDYPDTLLVDKDVLWDAQHS